MNNMSFTIIMKMNIYNASWIIKVFIHNTNRIVNATERYGVKSLFWAWQLGSPGYAIQNPAYAATAIVFSIIFWLHFRFTTRFQRKTPEAGKTAKT